MKRKVIALILIAVLVTTGMNLDIMPQSIYGVQKGDSANKKTEEKVTVVKELTD